MNWLCGWNGKKGEWGKEGMKGNEKKGISYIRSFILYSVSCSG